MKKDLTLKENFEFALKNHQENKLEVAEEFYKKILKTNPNHFESTFLLGTLSAQIKNFDVAKELLLKTIQINPNYADAHNNLGIVFKVVGDHQKAINYAKPDYISIHSLGGNEMIKAAVKASNYAKILTVSLLSHHNQKNIKEIGINISIKKQIKKLVDNALKNNVSGLILAPQDLEIIKKIDKKIEIFVPGIRTEKNKKNEHKRSLSPIEAIKKRATYIIIGRPITNSKNPKKSLELINNEIKNYLEKN